MAKKTPSPRVTGLTISDDLTVFEDGSGSFMILSDGREVSFAYKDREALVEAIMKLEPA